MQGGGYGYGGPPGVPPGGGGGWGPQGPSQGGGYGAPSGYGAAPQPGYGAPPAAAAPAFGAPAGAQYEFTAAENDVIDKLAGRLTIAGIMQIVFGGLQLLGGWSFGLPGYFVGLPGSLALIVIGALFVSSAGSFRSVTQTRGYDIQHLMGALGKLHTAATVQIIAYVAAVLLGILIGVIMLLFFAALLAGLR